MGTKVYVLVKISNGEDPCSLDGVTVFTNLKDAKKALVDSYRDIIDMTTGYELCENGFYDKHNYYEIQLDDDYGTRYYGTIQEREVQ